MNISFCFIEEIKEGMRKDPPEFTLRVTKEIKENKAEGRKDGAGGEHGDILTLTVAAKRSYLHVYACARTADPAV